MVLFGPLSGCFLRFPSRKERRQEKLERKNAGCFFLPNRDMDVSTTFFSYDTEVTKQKIRRRQGCNRLISVFEGKYRC